MASSKKLVATTLFGVLAFSLYLLGAAVPMRAQANSPSTGDGNPFDIEALKPWVASNTLLPVSVVPDSVSTDQPTTGDPDVPQPPQAAKSSPDDGWHFAVSPYLWLPGVHGTAFGPNGNGVGFKASPSDLLSNFQFGLLGAVEARHKWLVSSIDMMWLRLEDDKALPFQPPDEDEATSANIHASLFVLTPKIGVRLINKEMFKVDAMTGLRYWHIGSSLNFNPSTLDINFNGSTNFVDPLVGGHIELDLSPKIVINILGDVGGWNTGSKLEYQVGGVLGYRIKPALTLEAGYRYLNVDYFGGPHAITINNTMAGVLFGVTIKLK